MLQQPDRKEMDDTRPGWVAYVGQFAFPWGDAGSRRVYGIARSLISAGYRVVVGGNGAEPESECPMDCTGDAGSLAHMGLGEMVPKNASRCRKLVRYLLTHGKRTVRWLDSCDVKPSHIVLYDPSLPYLARLLSWCHRHRTALILDMVEWYHPREVAGGRFGPFYIAANVALRYLAPRSNGIIAISSYLEDYYRRRGCTVRRVPPTADVVNAPFDCRRRDKSGDVLSLVYAGMPGKVKDVLGNVITGLSTVDHFGHRVRLVVVGPTEAEASRMLGTGEKLPPSVTVLGRLSQQDVAAVVRKADFTVLLRPPLRYAMAGFPTKIVESMTGGVPVIANITSDLGRHVHDGVEGIVCRDYTAPAFADALRRALELTPEQLADMRVAARREAERSFDYRAYSAELAAMLEEVRCK